MSVTRLIIAGLLVGAAWLLLSPHSADPAQPGCRSPLWSMVVTEEGEMGNILESPECEHAREVRGGQAAVAVVLAGAVRLAASLVRVVREIRPESSTLERLQAPHAEARDHFE